MINNGEFEYVYGANRVPVAQINIETNEIQYLHSDFIGSVIAVTDDSSNIESILNYGAYGKRIGANVTRFGFAGEWVDTATGYSYNRARWYDSSTAHFLSKDPLVQSTREAYGYAGGNPLTRIDPSGKSFLDFDWTSNDLVDMSSSVISGFSRSYVDASGGINPCDEEYATTSTASVLWDYSIFGRISDGTKKSLADYKGKTYANQMAAKPKGRIIFNLKNESYEVGAYGGRYGDMKNELRKSLRINGAEVNHMPSKAWNKAKFGMHDNDGGAILMDRVDHLKTRTYGGGNSTIRNNELHLSLQEVLDRDIEDIRNLFGTKYDTGIEETKDYYRSKGLYV